MRNKKLTYILIPVVALLWGYIFYKIFWGVGNTPNYAITHQIKTDTLENKQEKFEYNLLVNYSDPFLKNNHIKKETKPKEETQQNQNTRSRRTRSRQNRKKEIPWPKIKYGGVITNESSDKITILVEINESKCLVNVGDIRKEVTIKRYYPDSIVVVYKGEEKTILK